MESDCAIQADFDNDLELLSFWHLSNEGAKRLGINYLLGDITPLSHSSGDVQPVVCPTCSWTSQKCLCGFILISVFGAPALDSWQAPVHCQSCRELPASICVLLKWGLVHRLQLLYMKTLLCLLFSTRQLMCQVTVNLVAVGFSLQTRIMGEGSTSHSIPRPFFFFSFLKSADQLAHTSSTLCAKVHSTVAQPAEMIVAKHFLMMHVSTFIRWVPSLCLDTTVSPLWLHIRSGVYACLSVTFHQHFWQNDRGFYALQ